MILRCAMIDSEGRVVNVIMADPEKDTIGNFKLVPAPKEDFKDLYIKDKWIKATKPVIEITANFPNEWQP